MLLLSRWKIVRAAVLVSGLFLAVASTARAADDLNSAWADLASADEVKAARALLALTATPQETTALLRQRLKPVKVDPAAVAKLVKDLDSDDVKTRDAASQELEYLGKFAKAELEKHLGNAPSAEVKKRLGDLMDKLPLDDKAPPPAPPQLKGRSISIQNMNGDITIIIDGKPLDLTAYGPRPVSGPNMNWVRTARATVVLEHLGTPEARQILERVADGEAAAPTTKAAREALERLKGKSK